MQGHIATYCTSKEGVKVQVIQDTRKVDGLGGEVWPGAHILCNHLEANAHQLKLANARVLELGAGCGMCGLVAAALKSPYVVLSDEYPDLLQKNIDMNQEWLSNTGQLVHARELVWGDKEIWNGDIEFDLILGSEITQLGRSLHRPLLETIYGVFHDRSMALLSMDACCDTCEGTCEISKCSASHFTSVAKEFGFHVKKHKSVLVALVESVQTNVGALGRAWPFEGNELSAVFELTK
jgi:hypothetical protein